MLPKPRYLTAGESALVAEFGSAIDPKIHDCVLTFDAAIERADLEGITETVPTYRSLMIHFDPHRLTAEALIDALEGPRLCAGEARCPARALADPCML